MTKDLNKGITKIEYNSLNLPKLMDIKSPLAEARKEYTYTASGAKLRVVSKWNPNFSTNPVIGSDVVATTLTKTKTTDYVGNIVYEDNALKRILVDGGYIEGGVYNFYLTDHLGNNRAVAKADASIIQRTQYYPFGAAFADGLSAGLQPYKYNGKELDAEHGVNWYDYSARQKSDFGFTSVDPHAENYYSWSPYAYVMNNPLRFIDPTGMDRMASSFVDPNGTILDARDDGDYAIYLVHNPSTWDGLKDGLLTIGYTPEPATFKNHIGKNLKSEEVINFWESEKIRHKKQDLFMSWRALQHLDKLAELKKNSERYKKALIEYRDNLKLMLLLQAKSLRNHGKIAARYAAQRQKQQLAADRILLRTMVDFSSSRINMPSDEVVDIYIPWDTTTIDKVFNNAIQKADAEYSNMFNDIINK